MQWLYPLSHRLARHVAAALCFAMGLSSAPARAQVNVEVLRRSLSLSGFGGKLDASVATYQGNTRGTNLGASGLIGAQTGRHLGYAHANGRYTRLGGEVSVANYFAHLRYNYQLAQPLWAEALAQAESDRFRRLELRQLLGAGVRWAAFDAPELAAYYGLTYLLEQRVAVGIRQHDIEKDQVRQPLAQQPQGRGAVAGLEHLVTAALARLAGQPPRDGAVVDEQDRARHHGVSLSLPWWRAGTAGLTTPG